MLHGQFVIMREISIIFLVSHHDALFSILDTIIVCVLIFVPYLWMISVFQNFSVKSSWNPAPGNPGNPGKWRKSQKFRFFLVVILNAFASPQRARGGRGQVRMITAESRAAPQQATNRYNDLYQTPLNYRYRYDGQLWAHSIVWGCGDSGVTHGVGKKNFGPFIQPRGSSAMSAAGNASQVKSSTVVGLRTRVAIIRTLIFSSVKLYYCLYLPRLVDCRSKRSSIAFQSKLSKEIWYFGGLWRRCYCALLRTTNFQTHSNLFQQQASKRVFDRSLKKRLLYATCSKEMTLSSCHVVTMAFLRGW